MESLESLATVPQEMKQKKRGSAEERHRELLDGLSEQRARTERLERKIDGLETLLSALVHTPSSRTESNDGRAALSRLDTKRHGTKERPPSRAMRERGREHRAEHRVEHRVGVRTSDRGSRGGSVFSSNTRRRRALPLEDYDMEA